MPNWILRGLRTGIKTTPYPGAAERTEGVTPGRPTSTPVGMEAAKRLEALCPTNAIKHQGQSANVDYRRCVACGRCREDGLDTKLSWTDDFEWAALAERAHKVGLTFDKVFGRSLHIRYVDAGACGGCMSEARQLNNPYYNIHRLGFFITPTPREADVLLVAGPVTDAMRVPLQKAYEAMPDPKRVVAMGVCAISGGVFGPSFICAGGVSEAIPVDVVVPGCPPPPLAILHGLLLAVERTSPVRLAANGVP